MRRAARSRAARCGNVSSMLLRRLTTLPRPRRWWLAVPFWRLAEVLLAAGRAVAGIDYGQRCRECGCDDSNACFIPGGVCEWVEPELCSGCAD